MARAQERSGKRIERKVSNFVLLQAPPIYGNLNGNAHQLMRSYVDMDVATETPTIYCLVSPGVVWYRLGLPGIPWYCCCTLYNLLEPLVGAPTGLCNHDLALPLWLECCKPFLPCLACLG